MPDTSLLDFAKAFANTMTKTDFEAAFKKVVDLVQAILKRHEQAIQSLEHEHKELYQHLRNEHASSLTELKTKTNQLFVEDRLGSMHSETKAGFSISGKIKRSDFGLTWNAITEAGSIVVSDEIKLNSEIQFIKQQ